MTGPGNTRSHLQKKIYLLKLEIDPPAFIAFCADTISFPSEKFVLNEKRRHEREASQHSVLKTIEKVPVSINMDGA